LIYARFFEGTENGPTNIDMRTNYGTYGYNSEFSLNPVNTYSSMNAKDVLFYFDNRWLILPNVSNVNFDWMWNSGHGYECKNLSDGAKSSINNYPLVYFCHWSTEIYEISTNTTWDSGVIVDLGYDTNHGAAYWDNANGKYKAAGGYQTPINTWLRLLVR
jgi:hypothetical protein